MIFRRIAFFGCPFILVFLFLTHSGCSGNGSSNPLFPDDAGMPLITQDDGLTLSGDDLTEGLLLQDDSFVPDIEESFREAALYADNEPNDGFDTAVEIPLYATADDPASGSINWPKAREGTTGSAKDPTDFYKVELTDTDALSVQLAGGQSRSVVRVWRYDASADTHVAMGERSGIGIPKALNFTGLNPGTYWIEITNPVYFTNYKLRVATGLSDVTESVNNSCSTQTPTMSNYERGTVQSSSNQDLADYWKMDTSYSGAVSFDFIYFKDYDKSVQQLEQVFRDKNVADLSPSSPVVEDDNHTYADYGLPPDVLVPNRYYAGVQARSGGGLYYLSHTLYSASFVHEMYPNPVKIIARMGGMSNTADVIFTNRGNTAVNWTLECASGRIGFDLETGYLAVGYSTSRKLNVADTSDPFWSTGNNAEEVVFTLRDVTSGNVKAGYKVPVNVFMVESDYAASWDPDPIEFADVDPAAGELQGVVKIMNSGCMGFYCSLAAAPGSEWLSFIKPPSYLAPGRATLVTFVVDVSGMTHDTSGAAMLTIENLAKAAQTAVEIPVGVDVLEELIVSGQPYAMPYGDRRHNASSDFIGPRAGAQVQWSSREFGTWNGQNVSGKTVKSAITIDENNRIFFSAQVKPLPRCNTQTYKYAVIALDAATGGLVALTATPNVPTAVSIDNEPGYWFAFDNGSRTVIKHTYIAGDTFADVFSVEVPGDPSPGIVLDDSVEQNGFMGISYKCPSSPIIGSTPSGDNVWAQALAVVGGKINSIPVVGDNGIVYFGDSAYNTPMLYGFRYDASNPDIDPHMYESAITGAVSMSPSIDSRGRVYVLNTYGQLYRFSPDLAEYEMVISGVKTDWSPVVDRNDVLYCAGTTELCAYDVAGDGAPVHKWSFGYPDKCHTKFASDAPVTDAAGNVYIGTDKRYVFGIDANGVMMWSVRVAGKVVYSPAIGEDGTLYVGDDQGYVYAIQ